MSRPGYAAGIGNRPQTVLMAIVGSAGLQTFAAHTRKFIMPQRGVIVGVGLNVGARGGTHITSTVDVKNGATSLLTALFDVAALTPGTSVQKEGSALVAAQIEVPKDTVVSVVVAESGGTSPTWQDVDLQIDYVPLGD